MADLKISELTNLTAADPANDMIPIVDVSATPPASGSTKRISINNILACSPSATLASATISGDLTVDTSTLKVDSANNRVGIGTATPARPLDIVGSFQSTLGWVLTGTPAGLGAATRYIGGASTTDSWYFNALTGGNHLWAFGESQAMRLDSTGLGVGGSAAARIHAIDSSGVCGLFTRAAAPAAALSAAYITAPVSSGFSNSPVYGFWYQNTGISNPASECFAIRTNTTDRLYVDATGNVGIGVTPSAKLDINGNSAIRLPSVAGSVDLQFPYFGATNAKTIIRATGTADWRQTLKIQMNTAQLDSAPVDVLTLDQSGNLILSLPSSPPTLGTNGQLTVNATSNTNLRFSYRGSDGVTRVANITLA